MTDTKSDKYSLLDQKKRNKIFVAVLNLLYLVSYSSSSSAASYDLFCLQNLYYSLILCDVIALRYRK